MISSVASDVFAVTSDQAVNYACLPSSLSPDVEKPSNL